MDIRDHDFCPLPGHDPCRGLADAGPGGDVFAEPVVPAIVLALVAGKVLGVLGTTAIRVQHSLSVPVLMLRAK